MKMRENIGMHHGLAYLCEAVITLLQNRKCLSAAMSLNSHFVSGVDAGHSTAFFNASTSSYTEVIQTGARHFLHRDYVVITE